jgi:hypothetical protein
MNKTEFEIRLDEINRISNWAIDHFHHDDSARKQLAQYVIERVKELTCQEN